MWAVQKSLRPLTLPIAGSSMPSGRYGKGGGEGEDEVLASAYARARSLEAAAEIGARCIGFPAISTGVFGFPADRAAGSAVTTVAAALARHPTIEEVHFACFNEAQAEFYRPELARRSP